MKLIHSVSIRISILALLVLGGWAVAFYFAIMEEVRDETDDALEDYAETIVIRSLVGKELPTTSIGTNNQYFQRRVSADYAARVPNVRYEDRDVYIEEKHEYEPARVLTYIYKDDANRYYELEVSTPTIEKHDLKEAIFHWLLLLFGALLLGIVLISVFSVHRTMRPLHRLLRWMARYRIGHDNPPLDNPTHISEFRSLNASVEESFRRGQQQYEQQKRFLGNAAHELQTPIAVCINRIEMLLEEADRTHDTDPAATAESQQQELVRLLRTLQHMSKLNSTLLTLSRIESGQFASVTSVDCQPIVEQIVDDMSMVFASRKIHTTLTADGHFAPRIDRQLAVMLLTNLIKNAYVHNVDGGSIHITITDTTLRIANSGEPQPLDAGQVFQPFVHNADKTSSTGLGLALVRTICQHNHLHISYHYDNGMHVFEVES